MSDPAYPAARAVARRAEAHFARHLELARARRQHDIAPEPDAAAIEKIISAAFWASLRREEGRTPTISLAFVPPSPERQPLTFARSLPLSPPALAKLAPAVERAGIHLGVWADDQGELRIWGTTRRLPAICFVLEVIASGLLVIKHRSDAFGKFVNVAVLEGDHVKIVDESTATVPDCPGLVASLLGMDAAGVSSGSINVLIQVAASMRAHGRGGALLLVPSTNQTWQESVLNPVLYAVAPAFGELAALVRKAPEARHRHEWQEEIRRAIDMLAGVTAVDGATLMTDQYELLAFGAKIVRRRSHAPVEKLIVTEPIEGAEKTTMDPYQLGGTRHFSAAQFVQDQPDATALVASQDGRFTIFKWSRAEESVHAHRVEALLL